MKCARCHGDDPGCYVCREEPQPDDRDPHKEAVERELEEETSSQVPDSQA